MPLTFRHSRTFRGGKMPRRPYFHFFPADWLMDTRILSPATKAGWIDLICAMHIAPEYGKLNWSMEQMGYYLGKQSEGILKELRQTGVAEVEYEGSIRVTVMSRRMVRKEIERNQWVERKRRERHGDVTPNVTPESQQSHAVPTPIPTTDSTTTVLNKNRKSPPSGSVHNYQEITLEGICMGRSMNLIPALKEIADKLYNSDTEKFKRLAKWINQGRKYNHLEENMAIALWGLWEALQNPKVEVLDWYPYADKILDDVEKDRGAAASDREHQRHKDEVREFVEKLGKDKF